MARHNNIEAANQEFVTKVIYLGRCTKVVTGGRKLTFAVIVVAGDQKGRVGIGLGKASEVMEARAKAEKSARRSMCRVPLKDGRTLHHDIEARFCAVKLVMRSAPTGTGIIAGGAVRVICELLGIKDVVAKIVGSTNSHNLYKVALIALNSVHSPRYIADKRGKKLRDIFPAE